MRKRNSAFSAPECRRTCQSIAVRIGAVQANPHRLLFDTLTYTDFPLLR
jgi:hypothetical protein